jgi:hypothetical protein
MSGRTYLKTAHERVGNVIFEEVSSLIVNAGPTPHILVVVILFALIQDRGSNRPHDDAEDEESNGEDGVVGCHFLSSIVASSEVCDHDDNRHNKRDTGNGQDDDLRPDLGVFGPRW